MRQIALMSLVGVFALSAATHGQSLADVARQEEERRKSLTTQGRVYTNEDLGENSQPAPPVAVTAAKPDVAASKTEPIKAETGKGEAEVGPEAPKAEANIHRDEKHWRGRAQQYRERLNKLRADVAAIQAKVETLRAAPQTSAVLGDIGVAEQDLMKFKNQLAFIDKEWSQIEQKAREDKIPGTWLQ